MKLILALAVILFSLTTKAQRSKLKMYNDHSGIPQFNGNWVSVCQAYAAFAKHFNLQFAITNDDPELHDRAWYISASFERGLECEITILDQILHVESEIKNDTLLVAYKPRPLNNRYFP